MSDEQMSDRPPLLKQLKRTLVYAEAAQDQLWADADHSLIEFEHEGERHAQSLSTLIEAARMEPEGTEYDWLRGLLGPEKMEDFNRITLSLVGYLFTRRRIQTLVDGIEATKPDRRPEPPVDG